VCVIAGGGFPRLSVMDIRELDRRALAHAGEIIARVDGTLTRPTPCPDWTLHGLLRHIVSQNEGFAAAARGGGGDLAVWRNGRLGADPRAAYEESARLVGEAFAEDGVPERMFDLPEVGGRAFPGRIAIGFHFVDTVVHAWDVAATIGVAWEPPDELLDVALVIAGMVPDTPDSRGPGLAFEPGVDVPEDAPGRERLLALLGRSPAWQAERC
jgi:uncharacterized protein (TIGR03086 family)